MAHGKINVNEYDNIGEDTRSEEEIIHEENLQVLKSLKGKKISLSTNQFLNSPVRNYLVDEVREATITTAHGQIPAICFGNEKVDEEDQPIFHFPKIEITRRRMETGQLRLTLRYPKEMNIRRDFKNLHKGSRNDLEVYIYFDN